MIQLKPILNIPDIQCPNCGEQLAVRDFWLTGMRNLADYICESCSGEFYGDLPSGQAFYTPILHNKQNGEVTVHQNAKWFSEWLADSIQNRSNSPLSFETRKFRVTKEKVILLNCLDMLYGHSLLKLLNAQYYLDYKSDFSLIVIVPSFLEWMLPDGLAEAWIIDLPLKRGTEWNDWLAEKIARKLEKFDQVFLSEAFSHPPSEVYDIENFTGVKPFDLNNFADFNHSPVITFIWREDRFWEGPASNSTLKQKFGFAENPVEKQIKNIISLADDLRDRYPITNFAVVGLGKTGTFPNWIKDLRKTKLRASDERDWCRRYAESQVVIGVHGSNMLLPSAHAASVVELLPDDRQGNFLQDILVRPTDARETLFRYRFVPLETSPENLAETVSILLRFEEFQRLMNPQFT